MIVHARRCVVSGRKARCRAVKSFKQFFVWNWNRILSVNVVVPSSTNESFDDVLPLIKTTHSFFFSTAVAAVAELIRVHLVVR